MDRATLPTALVTGAGSGIGRGVAEALAAAGHHVVCAGRRRERVEETAGLIRARGGSAVATALDVTDESQVTALIDAVAAERGRLDVLVGNAGVFHKGEVADQPAQDWRETVEVNLTGVFLCSQAAVRVMRRQQPRDGVRGHLFSVNSGAGVAGYATGAAYAASKHGLKGLVDSLRAEVAPDCVKVTDIVVSATVESEMSAGRNVPKIPASAVGDVVVRCLSLPGAAVIERVDLGQLRG